MSSETPGQNADDFPAGQSGDMRDVLLSQNSEAKAPSASSVWQPPTPAELQKLLPQYEITALLGRGGMGAVYKGRQVSLDREVAIKILSGALDESDQGFAERFKNEARAMAKLKHPGIVAVYDSGETSDGLLYIVMEFIEGTDVARMIAKQGRLHSEHAMAITAHVCDALAYAHARGIIHRDIKPANIMVGYDGVVKVADFGLAKMNHAQTTGLTQSGMAMGTLYYMAPEALMLGSAVDQRADIYAVGVMLYQMLTGKLPQGLFELPSLQIPGLDPRYDSIIGKALREDREMRYPNAQDMRHDLDAILTQPVVKVEAAAEHAPAALPTEVRPQRTAGKPYRPPPQVIVRTGTRSSRLPWVAVIAFGGVAMWFYIQRGGDMSPPAVSQSERTASQPAEPTATPPASTVPNTQTQTASVSPKSPPAKKAKNAKSSGTAPPVRAVGDPPNTSKRVTDVLKLVVTKNMFMGGWSVASGDWTSNENDSSSGLQFAHAVTVPEYDYELEFTLVRSSTGLLHQRIPVAGKAVEWVLPFSSTGGRLRRGFSGQDDATATQAGSPLTVATGARHRCVVKVRKDSLSAELDGTVVGFWSGDPGQAKEMLNRFFDPRFFAVEVEKAEVRLHRAQVTEFVPVPQIDLTKVPATGWQPMFADVKKLKEARGVTELSGGWFRLDKAFLHPCNARDIALRARIKNGGNVTLVARCLDDSEKPMSKYWAGFNSYANGVVLFRQWSSTDPGSPRMANITLATHVLTPPLAPGGDHVLTLMAVGDQLRVFINDTLVIEKQDKLLPGSFAGIEGGGEVSDLEWISFSDPSVTTDLTTTAVLPGGPTTWTDLKGRSLTATFKAIASGNVLLDIAGKITPVPLNTLSAESQKLAQQLDAARKLADAADPAKANQQQPFTNTLGMKFVPVPGTKVLFCVHETRYQDYAAFAEENSTLNPAWKRQELDGFIPVERPGEHPVAYVSWDDADAFCQWLSRKEGRTYRLPTDLEWSIAAGIDTDENRQPGDTVENVRRSPNLFPWGRTWPPPKVAGNFSDQSRKLKAPHEGSQYLEGYDDGFPTTAPVMSFSSNRLGIHDLGGNVWEWVRDWWNDQKTERVMRGGSLQDFDPPSLSLSVRNNLPSGYRNYNRGFRCVVEVTQVAAVESKSADPAAVQTSSPSGPAAVLNLGAVTKDKPFTNILGMQFVPVPKTKVLFCIHETRRQDYTAFAAQNPGTDSAWRNALESGVPVGDQEDHPVVNVSWNDAQTFCAWLSKKEGRTYRLPTDREWSTAVGLANREPTGMTPEQLKLLPQNADHFPWGTTWPPPKDAGNFSDTTASAMLPPDVRASSIEGYTDGFATTAPVMSFTPNRLGLYDLAGNVFEMVEDCIDATRTERVVRGHSYAGGNRRALLSSNRGTCDPNARITRHGFRVVLDPVSATVVPGSSAGAAPRTTITTAASVIPSITKDKPLTNTLGMKFVPVPDTKVLFSIWETRVQDYSVFARAEKVDDSWKNRQRNGIPVARDRDHPVVSVNWDEAQAFCRWLTDKETAAGKLSKGWLYRLPKDEEWSIAVGLPPEQGLTPADKGRMNRSFFPWGTGFPPPNAKVGNYADTEWHDKFPTDSWLTGYSDGYATTAPVGSFPANIHGLHDLGGNVWEWCDDLLTGSGTKRVLRGGCWGNSSSDDLNSACRYFFSDPETHVHSYGFRCVLQISP